MSSGEVPSLHTAPPHVLSERGAGVQPSFPPQLEVVVGTRPEQDCATLLSQPTGGF